MEKIALYGFNNLTKSLSWNLYDVCYAETPEAKRLYLEYIDEQYNSERLTEILVHLTEMIGANILNISKQDYEPQGASVNILISEQPLPHGLLDPSNNAGHLKSRAGNSSINLHLDKSHVTVHTFPEAHPDSTISTFRVDLDIATCGEVVPLNTLDYLIGAFEADVMTVDYRVRGFTRDHSGKKIFIDHDINSVCDYISPKVLAEYKSFDCNLPADNFYHTRLCRKLVSLDDYLFNRSAKDLLPAEQKRIRDAIESELEEIFVSGH